MPRRRLLPVGAATAATTTRRAGRPYQGKMMRGWLRAAFLGAFAALAFACAAAEPAPSPLRPEIAAAIDATSRVILLGLDGKARAIVLVSKSGQLAIVRPADCAIDPRCDAALNARIASHDVTVIDLLSGMTRT